MDSQRDTFCLLWPIHEPDQKPNRATLLDILSRVLLLILHYHMYKTLASMEISSIISEKINCLHFQLSVLDIQPGFFMFR